MWGVLDGLYDLGYFILKNAEDLRLQPLIFYLFYLIGKRRGMKVVKNYLEKHFPNTFGLTEETQWRLWVQKNIESINGATFILPREYRGVTRSRKFLAKNSAMSLTLSPEENDQEENNMKIVVLDAGHGGKDTGAIGYSAKKEKDFNLSMVLKVEALLLDHPEVTVKLTRSTDVFIDLIERSNIANRLKADVFISFHANSATLASTSGTETLYTNPMSKAFAELMHPLILAVTGGKNRKVKYQNLSVCRNTKMPAILLEPEFLSNKLAEEKLFNPLFQDKLAEAIAEGICQFLNVEYLPPVSTDVPKETTPIVKPLPVGLSALSVIANAQVYTGYLQNGTSWIPAKPILNYLNNMWTFQEKRIVLEGVPLETTIIDNQSYIKAKDLLIVGARIFFDNDTAPKRLDIFPKLEG